MTNEDRTNHPTAGMIEEEQMASSYDPGADSTPALARHARDAHRVVLDISDSACLCGCKEPTPGRFRPGHDARLKGKLLRAHMAKVGLLILKDGKERPMTARAFAKEVSSETYDWTTALDRASERQKEAATALRDKVVASLGGDGEQEKEPTGDGGAVAS